MILLASHTGEVIERTLWRDMLVSDFAQIQSTIDAISEDTRIKSLLLLDTSGRVVFAPHQEGVGLRLSNEDEQCQQCHQLPAAQRPSGVLVYGQDETRVFRSMHPIENQGECKGCHDPDQRLIGLLLTDIAVTPFTETLASSLRENLYWWVGTVVVTGALSYLAVNRWVLRRLRELAMAIGDFGRTGRIDRLSERPQDEIGGLSGVFNKMVDRIKERESENARLSQELQVKAEEKTTLLRRLIVAQEKERKRVARELHDDLGQSLSSTALQLEMARKIVARDPKQAEPYLESANALIAESTDRMYDLILGLRPSVLDDLGLVAALRAHCARTLEPVGIQCEMEVEGLDRRLPSEVETVLFRIFQEALNNVQRHAQASRVTLKLQGRDGRVEGAIMDNGRGFNTEEVSKREGPSNLGLMGMRERAEQCGGEVEVDSSPGGGTQVRVQIPFDKRYDE
jgi:signal transduction histidine kinase